MKVSYELQKLTSEKDGMITAPREQSYFIRSMIDQINTIGDQDAKCGFSHIYRIQFDPPEVHQEKIGNGGITDHEHLVAIDEYEEKGKPVLHLMYFIRMKGKGHTVGMKFSNEEKTIITPVFKNADKFIVKMNVEQINEMFDAIAEDFSNH